MKISRIKKHFLLYLDDPTTTTSSIIQTSLAFMSRREESGKKPEGILTSRILTRKNDTSVVFDATRATHHQETFS